MTIYYRIPGRPRRGVEDEDFWKAKSLTAGLDTDDLDPESFAVACFNSNYIEELLVELDGAPGQLDMDMWGITAQQWREEMLLGLAALVRQVEEYAEDGETTS